MIISESEEKKPTLGSDRKHPALATIKERYLLTASSSTKSVYHLSLDLKTAPLNFKVGDSIGVFAQNDPLQVQELLSTLGHDPQTPILDPKTQEMITLVDFLSSRANLRRISSSMIKLFHHFEPSHDKSNQLLHLLQPEHKGQLTAYLESREPLDLLREHPQARPPLQDICNQFSSLLPRFYSVASSPSTFPKEAHLTVALSSYKHRDVQRYGVASHFLCHLAELETTSIPVYVQSAHHFTLPQDDTLPIIMVGPGTGVAPFRAFLQERYFRQATGRNWLFFGDRHHACDFFYREEWDHFIHNGMLKFDTAFSRDQPEKIYVQNKMYEHAAEIWKWLQEGAYFYVCGDAHRMAKDVEAMVQQIVQEQGHMSLEAAKAYVKQIRTQKRYLTDVY